VNFGAQELRKGICRLQGILENATMLCHAMHPMQDFFGRIFICTTDLICNLYALLCWQNFILVNSGCYTPAKILSVGFPRHGEK
jgi:hypothetical protein